MSLRLSGGRRLRSPPGELARPTASRLRLAVMNLLAAELSGCRWLDLCCGSGAMACEALQRGAREVVAVDHHRRIAALARANLEAVAASLPADVRVHCADVVRWLGKGTAGPFDLIYVDPPYASGLYAAIGAAVASGAWLRPRGTMVWECASDLIPDLPTGWQLRDRRRYGGSTLLLLQEKVPAEAALEPGLSPPGPSRDGTDSMPPRTDPPG